MKKRIVIKESQIVNAVKNTLDKVRSGQLGHEIGDHLMGIGSGAYTGKERIDYLKRFYDEATEVATQIENITGNALSGGEDANRALKKAHDKACYINGHGHYWIR